MGLVCHEDERLSCVLEKVGLILHWAANCTRGLSDLQARMQMTSDTEDTANTSGSDDIRQSRQTIWREMSWTDPPPLEVMGQKKNHGTSMHH